MIDRVVQYPNRYKFTPVSGTTDTYDLTVVPGTVAQEGDPLCKATLLPDNVAAVLGLSGNPQVKDALASIGSTFSTLNIYKWDKFAYSVNPSTFSHYQSANISVSAANTNVATVSIAYSAELNFSVDGVPTLRNPITITDTLANIVAKYGATLKGKYVSDLSDNWIYHVHPTMGSLSYYYPTGGSGYYLSAYRDIVYPNLWGYNYIQKTVYAPVSSTDPLKYPQSGAAGDYLYRYSGALHDFSVSNIVGSYTGTGVYGTANKNTLNIDPKTRLVVIRPVSQRWNQFGIFIVSDTLVGGNTTGCTPAFAYLGGTAVCELIATFNNGTLSWYNTSAAQYQLNDTQTYEYTCLC